MNVRLSKQINEFISHLPPESKRTLRIALRNLELGKADVKHLQGELEGFSRLRAGSYRVIFATQTSAEGPLIDCLFVQHRSLIYEVFASTYAALLKKT